MDHVKSIKNRQIAMVVMTVLALVMEIVSLVNNYWISDLAGRICQIFHMTIANEPGLRENNPAVTMEMLIMTAFIILVCCPLRIVLEKCAQRGFKHFVGVNRALFALSGVSWLIMPVIVMQFFPGAPIVLGFTHLEAQIALHIWFYLTLLLYVLLSGIYTITERDESLNDQHHLIAALWESCGCVWCAVGKVVIVLLSFEFIILFWIIKGSLRS